MGGQARMKALRQDVKEIVSGLDGDVLAVINAVSEFEQQPSHSRAVSEFEKQPSQPCCLRI